MYLIPTSYTPVGTKISVLFNSIILYSVHHVEHLRPFCIPERKISRRTAVIVSVGYGYVKM